MATAMQPNKKKGRIALDATLHNTQEAAQKHGIAHDARRKTASWKFSSIAPLREEWTLIPQES